MHRYAPSRRRGLKLVVLLATILVASFAPLPNLTFAQVPVLDRVPVVGVAPAAAEEIDDLRQVVDEASIVEPAPAAVEGAEPTVTPTGSAPAEVPSTSSPAEDDHDHDAASISEDRVAAVAEQVESFSTIGVLFDAEPEEPVLVRTQGTDGSWGEWRLLELETDEGPDSDSAEQAAAAGRFGSVPVWVDDAIGYEVNLAAGDSDGAEVALVREREQRVVTDSVPAAEAALPRPFDIRTRDAWGAAPASVGVSATINLAVVHHTAGNNNYSPSQVPGVIRGIQTFHMEGRGWSDIAYNFVVDKYGGIWEGRAGSLDQPSTGAHAAGFNTNAVGVVIIGDYVNVEPSADSIESVSRVIGWKLATHGVNPVGSVTRTAGTGSTKFAVGTEVTVPRVVGHGDVGSTTCPGSISGYLGHIRNRAQGWAEAVRGAANPTGSADVFGVAPGTVAVSGWAADPDASGPVAIRLTVGGTTGTGTTGIPRSDVAAAVPFAGPTAGFYVEAVGVRPGYHDACVTALNQNYGVGDADLGCRPVLVPDPTGRAPTGSMASSGFNGGFDFSGTYSIAEPNSVVAVGLEVDGVFLKWTAPSNGRFSERQVGWTHGVRTVCAVAASSDGSHTRIGCQLVDIGGGPAIGSVDRMEYKDGRIHVAGWALDRETVAPIPVAVIFGSYRETMAAALRRDDIGAAYPGYGAEHGFAASHPVGPGTHRVCVEFGGVGAGSNVAARCEQIVVK